MERESEKSELVKPVIDAQTQLNRLKDLMQSLFRSQYFLNETVKPGHETPRPEEINVEYTYAHVNKPSDNHDVNDNHEEQTVKPTESTRLEIFKSIQTPNSRHHKPDQFNLDFFSPITSVIKTQYEQDYSEQLSDATNPTVTFNCITSDKNDDDHDDHDDDPSLTKYNLSDLSRRLGGTHLYISRDNGLDITDQLEDADPEVTEEVVDTTKYTETMEELEQLMVKLSDVFQTFRETPASVSRVKEEESLLGLVNGFNEDIYGFISKSKESCI